LRVSPPVLVSSLLIKLVYGPLDPDRVTHFIDAVEQGGAAAGRNPQCAAPTAPGRSCGGLADGYGRLRTNIRI
jgi:hypothetical protein